MIRPLRNLAAFLAGLIAAAYAVAAFVPAVRPSPTAAKLDWFTQHGAATDVVFIGSSRVHRQLIPALFDAEMATHGHPVKSFNLSADGMRPPEDMFVLERAFAGRTAPLRLLVVECNPIEANIADDDAGTERAVYWHDATRLGWMLRHVAAKPLGEKSGLNVWATRFWKRTRQFPAHIQHWLWNTGRAGEGSEWLAAQLFSKPARDESRDLGEAGYRVPKTREGMKGKTLANYERDLAAAKKRTPPHDPEDAISQESIAWKRALAARHGARLVLVSSPFLRPEIFVPATRDGIVFLDYSDPNAFPELYDPAHRRDPGHLNVAGSEIYTKLVARQIAEALKPQP